MLNEDTLEKLTEMMENMANRVIRGNMGVAADMLCWTPLAPNRICPALIAIIFAARATRGLYGGWLVLAAAATTIIWATPPSAAVSEPVSQIKIAYRIGPMTRWCIIIIVPSSPSSVSIQKRAVNDSKARKNY